MHLKLFVLSASSVVLWLAPLVTLDKTLNIHKALQGVSLTAAIACAVTAGNLAREQAEQNDIEEIKTRAITADVVDEIATSAYISQQQRQQEAEQILNPREQLERLLALTYDESERSEPIAQKSLAEREQNDAQNSDAERAERILQLKAKGWGKAKIILEIWGVSKGGSPKYKAAEIEYEGLIQKAGGQ
jgi:flagellar motility protein MotE (MotC chaperone)